MLVLTRRKGEKIMIGDDIEVTVLEASRDQVKIGIAAPRSVVVHRHEVYAEIRSENQAASRTEAIGGAVTRPAALPTRPPRD